MSSSIIRVDDHSIDATLFASIATRTTSKILEILIHQVGVANGSVIAIVIIVYLIMYFNTHHFSHKKCVTFGHKLLQ